MHNKEYDILYDKLVNNTITNEESIILTYLAFGNTYMFSDNKGTLVEY